MKRSISFELTQSASSSATAYTGVLVHHAGLPDVAIHRAITPEQIEALTHGPMPSTLRALADLLETTD